MGFQAGVGQIVLAGVDHEHIGGGVEQAQAEVVMKMAAVMDEEAEIGGLGRPALAKHHQHQLLQRYAGHLAAQALHDLQQQIRPLTGIDAAAHYAKQQQRTLGR